MDATSSRRSDLPRRRPRRRVGARERRRGLRRSTCQTRAAPARVVQSSTLTPACGAGEVPYALVASMFRSTTSIVFASSAVGWNSTTSEPA
jgi:hypothetical protein